MKVIYKYKLNTASEQAIELPHNAEILCLQTQNNQPHIWVKIDTSDDLLARRLFLTVGTGSAFPDIPAIHIGTYQLNDGELVFHVFEIFNPLLK